MKTIKKSYELLKKAIIVLLITKEFNVTAFIRNGVKLLEGNKLLACSKRIFT